MKLGSTNFLRMVVLLMGLIVLTICVFTVPSVIKGNAGVYRPILLGMYVAAIPFFFALYQIIKLLKYVDETTAFSELSVKALRHVKYCALIISGLYAAGLPFLFMAADKDDAPGVFVLGLVIAGTSFVVATATAVLQKLIQNAVDIKLENDLTV